MTSSEIEREPRLLPRLTAFRWYAALAVCLYHLGSVIDWGPLSPFTLGTTGVSFFYVLSGFVLVWSFRADPSPRRFYRRRFARIYPATFTMTAVAATLGAAGLYGIRHGVLGAVTSILLIQAWFPGHYPVFSYNDVAWSLSCEAFFYALLPWLVVVAASRSNRKLISASAVLLGAAVVTTRLLGNAGHGFDIAYTNPLVRLPEFVVGVVLGVLVVRGWRPSFPWWQALPLLAVGAEIGRHWPLMFPLPFNDYLLLPGFVGLLLSGIGSDLRGRRGFLTAPLSVYLGELSFCFYLVHLLVLDAVLHAAGWTNESFSVSGGVLPTVVVLAASIGAAAALHHAVELPMQSVLRPKRPALEAVVVNG